jgi:hypothetical protein
MTSSLYSHPAKCVFAVVAIDVPVNYGTRLMYMNGLGWQSGYVLIESRLKCRCKDRLSAPDLPDLSDESPQVLVSGECGRRRGKIHIKGVLPG